MILKRKQNVKINLKKNENKNNKIKKIVQVDVMVETVDKMLIM